MNSRAPEARKLTPWAESQPPGSPKILTPNQDSTQFSQQRGASEAKPLWEEGLGLGKEKTKTSGSVAEGGRKEDSSIVLRSPNFNKTVPCPVKTDRKDSKLIDTCLRGHTEGHRCPKATLLLGMPSLLGDNAAF